MNTLIDRVASRWVEVTVHSSEDGTHFLLRRRPGPAGPERFPVVHPAETLDEFQRVALVAPAVHGDTLAYLVGGPSSAAAWLGRPEDGFLATALDTIGRVVTVTVGVVERSPEVAAVVPAPLRRLDTHLRDRAPSAEVLRWRAALTAAMGADAATTVAGWLTEHLAAPSSPAHGGLSIGAILPTTTGLPDCLLSGEDWGRAAPGHDVGWLLGELLELADSADRRDAATLAGALRDVVPALASHAPDGLPGLRRAAALRVALHAEDFSHFVGWDDSLHHRASVIAAMTRSDTWSATGQLDRTG